MNRQQRRLLARRHEAEARCEKQLEELHLRRMDAQLEFFAVAIGLAHHNLYGANKDEYIEPLLREWNEQIRRIVEEETTFPELQKELLEKTGVYFKITD